MSRSRKFIGMVAVYSVVLSLIWIFLHPEAAPKFARLRVYDRVPVVREQATASAAPEDDSDAEDTPLAYFEPIFLPNDRFIDVTGAALGQSCSDACDSQGMICDESMMQAHLASANNCKTMTYLFGCPRGCVEDAPGPDQPAFFEIQHSNPEAAKHKHRGACLLNGNPAGIPPTCPASYPLTRRACVCLGRGAPSARAPAATSPPRPKIIRPPRASPPPLSTPLSRIQVFIAVHASWDKLENIFEISKAFGGPVKAAVFSDENAFVENLNIPENLEIKIVRRTAGDSQYPVNFLRQISLSLVPSGENDYVLAIDADFIPSENLHREILYWMPWISEHKMDSVFVVPAFESARGQPPPKTVQDLDSCREKKKCFFVLELKHPVAHEAVDYDRWDGAAEPYEIEYVWTFEPYILGLRRCLPDYPLQFKFYGNDKISWLYQIGVWGAAFRVLPRGFLTHKWHPNNSWRTKELDAGIVSQVEKMFMEFARGDAKRNTPPPQCYGVRSAGLLS